AYEIGVLNGGVRPGDTVAIVGAGPVGLAAIMTAKLFTPARIVVFDLAKSRLDHALAIGADIVIDNGKSNALAEMMELTGGLGADVAIEAVGLPDTFELCTELVRPGGRVANVGVHGHSATLHLERLWIRDITITMGLVDTKTTPTLLDLVANGRLDPTVFATHHFGLSGMEDAYDTFANAAETNALKVVLSAQAVEQVSGDEEPVLASAHR
ncbi:MAG: zinc-binding dehydrogenase, partial [Actinomycetota bacterium]